MRRGLAAGFEPGVTGGDHGVRRAAAGGGSYRASDAGGIGCVGGGSQAVRWNYAVGRYIGQDWLDIPEMAAMHGAITALGFSLRWLAGWILAGAKAADAG